MVRLQEIIIYYSPEMSPLLENMKLSHSNSQPPGISTLQLKYLAGSHSLPGTMLRQYFFMTSMCF